MLYYSKKNDYLNTKRMINYSNFIIIFSTIFFFICLPDIYAFQKKITIGNIKINKETKEIRIQSKLAIRMGILEYFLVGDHGKTYESVFKVSDNKPSELNFALLLVGFVPLNYQLFLKISQKKNYMNELITHYRNSLISISIATNEQTYDTSFFIANRESKKKDFPWVFTGSYFIQNNRFAGDFESNFIAIWPDRSAVVNLCSDLKNPYRGNYGFELTKKKFDLEQDFEIIIRRY